MKVAFVHDWLVTYRGGEKVLEALLSLYPDAPVYTLFYDPKKLPPTITNRKIITPRILRPFNRVRKALLPVLPTIVESFPTEKFDLVISTSSCVAKGVLTNPNSKHLCYVHSPMRYIWDQRQHYLQTLKKIPIISGLVALISNYLRLWDVSSSQRVDQFISNSNFVKSRVSKYYGKDSKVIHPPIEINKFRADSKVKKEGYFLVAGAFVQYKRFDLAIKACERAGVRLVVAGSGPLEKELEKMGSELTTIVNSPNQSTWISLLQKAEALIFPGIEDFGIVPIEAMASGTPVIAFRGGGALDYIVEGKTGVFFDSPTVDSLETAIRNFNSTSYNQEELVKFSQRFNQGTFLKKMKDTISELTGKL